MADVLVVEDDQLVIDMLQVLLEQDNHQVSAAHSGQEALQFLEKAKPEVMITDIVMPKTSGLNLIRQVRQKNPNIKIIAISGGGREGPESYLNAALTLGADMIFEKPLDNTKLLDAVKNLH
ncbi:MAG: response regulator [Gammaproteobacteria bacterium]